MIQLFFSSIAITFIYFCARNFDKIDMNSFLKKLYPIEIITILWIILTGIYILIFKSSVRHISAESLLLARLTVMIVLIATILLDKFSNGLFWKYFRQITPLVLIIYWYSETYYYNQLFLTCIDPWLIAADQWLFGCQPSTLFSEWMPQPWFNELMNFSYMSYYIAIFSIILYYLSTEPEKAFNFAFVVLNSFFVYYLFFIFLPSEGPQFFVCSQHNVLPVEGVMRKFLLMIQFLGEKPTGAFPSSHVGVMTIYMIFLWKHCRPFYRILFVFSILLALSTVYIKAHYVIDMIFGFITAYPIYLFSEFMWKKMNIFSLDNKALYKS